MSLLPPRPIQKSPIVFWAFFFLIGVAIFLFPHWIYLVPLTALFFFTKRKMQGILFLFLGWAITYWNYPNLNSIQDQIKGRGEFILEKIQPSQSPFHRSLALKGKFLQFAEDDRSYRNIPCTIFQSRLPKTGSRWIIDGTLQKKGPFSFIFKPQKKTPWLENGDGFSFSKWRYKNKEKVRCYFHQKIGDKKVSHFFASMATGDIDDRLLAMEFRKIGLGHILAISGFHFALIAAVLGWILRIFLPPKIAYISLLVILTLYCIFLGASPSILRAFVMIGLYVLGRILNRPIDGKNLLGTALLLELIMDPLALTNVGFQLSFLATFAILVFYRPLSHFLEILSPKRSLFLLKQMPRLDQHGYLLSCLIREALALTLAVQLTTLPVVLFVFHQFPLLSLPYNLLFPPLLGISLILIPFGTLFPPIRLLNIKFTSFLLQCIANPPEILNFKLFVGEFPFFLLILLLTIPLVLGLTKTKKAGRIEAFYGGRSSVG